MTREASMEAMPMPSSMQVTFDGHLVLDKDTPAKTMTQWRPRITADQYIALLTERDRNDAIRLDQGSPDGAMPRPLVEFGRVNVTADVQRELTRQQWDAMSKALLSTDQFDDGDHSSGHITALGKRLSWRVVTHQRHAHWPQGEDIGNNVRRIPNPSTNKPAQHPSDARQTYREIIIDLA